MERDVVAPERKIKIPIPAVPMNRDLRQATGYFGIFSQSHGIEAPRFAKKRICIYNLNISRGIINSLLTNAFTYRLVSSKSTH